MSDINTTSLADRLQDLELGLERQQSKQFGCGQALREAILCSDDFMEVEVLKSLGDLCLKNAKLSKDSAEFDKAAGLYAGALLRCTDPDMGQTLEHRIGYMEQLSRQLLQGYTPHFRWLSSDYWGTADSNVLRVAEVCDKLDKKTVGTSWHSVVETYMKQLVSAIANGDAFLEVEVLKSLGDFYLEKGKKASDVSQFSKATAMYNKALTRCEDPGTKPTLEHRIRYMDKIREKVRKQKPSPNRYGSGPTGSRPKVEVFNPMEEFMISVFFNDHLPYPDISSKLTEPGNSMQSVEAGTGVEERLTDSQCKDHLKEGESSLARADIDSAEQHFAAALKMVHVRDPTAQQYQREVEPLSKLGDVYSKRGQQTGDGGDFVKAAALYNAAIVRSKDEVLNGNIVTAMKEVEKSFLKCTLDTCHNVSLENTEKYKKQLKEMRDQIKLEMETIDQQLDPYVHDEDDPCVKEIEAKRAQAVRQLFENIAQQRKEFISLLVEECIGLMGAPPCKYALIGLGSQATGLVTPYSDLEFAILVEEESEECLVYFRNLTHYLHLKVVNLGETILPALGIKSLNDFYSKDPLDNWYYDSVTPRGFAFDGSMPKASKTPLGRQGTMDKPQSELIHTPSNMVSIMQNDATLYLKEGYHLATILRNPCLIAGDQDLIDTYMAITGKILQADGGKMAQQLAQETQGENIKRYKEKHAARLIDVKKDLYRFPAVAVDCLALSSGIVPTTVWKTIEEMENQQVISPNNAHHLTVLTSISAELRLRTYIANGGQKENLSALASMESMNAEESFPQTNALTAVSQVCHIQNEKQLVRYYQTSAPLKQALSECSEKAPGNKSFADFYDDSPRVQGLMYSELCKYRQAISYYEKALKKPECTKTEKMELLRTLGQVWLKQCDYQKSVSYSKKALEMHRSIYGQNREDDELASILSNLGVAWGKLNDQSKAISYLEQALKIERSIYGYSTDQPDIAISLHNLGSFCMAAGDYRKAISYYDKALKIYFCGRYKNSPHIALLFNSIGQAWHGLGDHRKAIRYYEQVLQMFKILYGQGAVHPHIANSAKSLGAAWQQLGDLKKAMSYHEEALQIYRIIHGQDNQHPDIAESLNIVGSTWIIMGDYRKAISYLEQALQMYRGIYGHTTAHPGIAASLLGLGGALSGLGDHMKAVSYHQQALQMYRSIYGQSTAHPDIARLIAVSLFNLGMTLNKLGEHRKAIDYHEQALKMYRSILGPSAAHSVIATSLSMLGMAWGNLGNYKKAVSYHEQALQMYKSVHGQSAARPEIVTSLRGLGAAYEKLGDYGLALRHLEQALAMCRSIYGQNAENPHIVKSLSNLGSVWCSLENHRKAASYHEQALKMYRSIHGQSTAHKDIAESLSSLAVALNQLGEHKKVVSYLEEALQIYRSIHGESKAHKDIAASLIGLGAASNALGEHKKAASYHEQALQMYRSIHGQSMAPKDIAESLIGLAVALNGLGDHKKAASHYEQALQMYRSIHGRTAENSDIAKLLHNLGTVWCSLENYRKGASYLEQALKMYRSIHGPSTAHKEIAKLLSSLAVALYPMNEGMKAVSYHEQALQMYRSIYGQTAETPDIANSLGNLGTVWYSLDNYRKAISYHEQALQMRKRIYGQDTAHPDIASSLSNMGKAWRYSGNPSKAIQYHEQALQIIETLSGQDKLHLTAHATSLRNLGEAWCATGESRKAISYYEQALEMFRSIYGQDKAHSRIGSTLNGLGSAWSRLGDYSKATCCHEQALQMYRSIYGQSTAHVDTAATLSKLGVALCHRRNHTTAKGILQESLALAKQLSIGYESSPWVKNAEIALFMIQAISGGYM